MVKESVEFAEARWQEECEKISRAFGQVRDIAQGYLDTKYPEAPDPNLFADKIIQILEDMPHKLPPSPRARQTVAGIGERVSSSK